MIEKKKRYIAFGGPSREHEVSLASTQAALTQIDAKKYEITLLYFGKNYQAKNITYSGEYPTPQELVGDVSYDQAIQSIPNDAVVLIMMHGEFGEDGTLQTLLEFYGKKFTGSGSYASRLCMDKYHSSLVVKNMETLIIPKTELLTLKEMKMYGILLATPFVIKPNCAGSSVGTYIVNEEHDFLDAIDELSKTFTETDQFVMQKFVKGIEVSCGVLQSRQGIFTELPPIEIIPKTGAFFDYEAKYTVGGSEEVTPPRSLSKEISDKISHAAQQVHQLLGCREYSRSDFIVAGTKIYYLETNTLPGMTATSLLPKEAAANGISYPTLLDFLVENA